jgi:hypothetical protein
MEHKYFIVLSFANVHTTLACNYKILLPTHMTSPMPI